MSETAGDWKTVFNDWSTAERIDWRDIGWTVQVKDEFNLEFRAFRIMGELIEDGRPSGKLLYEKLDGSGSMDSTIDLADAQPEFEGFIKWDGCSHWSWFTQDVMAHVCGYDALVAMQACQQRLFVEARKRIEHWDDTIPMDAGVVST